ncbi:MAG: hypothetical protein EP315_07380, partial [Gammaproteobacteria bacterium]
MYKTRSSNLFTSITGLVLLLGLLLALVSPRFAWVGWLDGAMFSLGSAILPKPDGDNPLRVIQLSPDVLASPDGIKNLRKVLKKLQQSDTAATALLIDPMPMLDYETAEDDNEAVEAQWSLTRGELSKLAWSLENYGVQVGIGARQGSGGFFASPLTRPVGEADGLQKWLPGIFNTPKYVLEVTEDSSHYPFERLPYSGQPHMPMPLVWFDDKGKNLLPDLALRLYQQLHKNSDIKWLAEGSIQLATQQIHTDTAGRAYGYFSAAAGRNAPMTVLDMNRALEADSRSFRNKIVILGVHHDDLTQLANTFGNLYADSLYHTPAGLYWLALLLLPMVLIYSFVLLPRVHKYTAILLSVLVVLIGMISQYGLLLTQAAWLPLIPVYLYLIFGHIVVHFRHMSEARLDHLRLQAHEAFKNLGSYQFEQGDHDKAMVNLLKCKPTDDVLEMLYDIGLGFERRRQYDKALHLYSEISVRHKDYKDVKKRLASLSSVSGTQTEVLSPSQAAKTLVLTNMDLQLPVLGRYELEKELG